jgi:hypothetical protein
MRPTSAHAGDPRPQAPFGGAGETLSPSSSVEVRCVHADGDCVVVEHSGRNEMPDDRRYDNNWRYDNHWWVLCGLLNDSRSGGYEELEA